MAAVEQVDRTQVFIMKEWIVWRFTDHITGWCKRCIGGYLVMEKELHSEIEEIVITDKQPTDWTYPLIQPKLLAEVQKRGY